MAQFNPAEGIRSQVAEAVRRLLSERPKISGIAVPGMPIGSPGMEGPNPERYQVLSFGVAGTRVFSEHGP